MRTDFRRAPQRNEDFGHVVRELLSYDDDRIAALVDSGAFGDADTTPYLPKA